MHDWIRLRSSLNRLLCGLLRSGGAWPIMLLDRLASSRRHVRRHHATLNGLLLIHLVLGSDTARWLSPPWLVNVLGGELTHVLLFFDVLLASSLGSLSGLLLNYEIIMFGLRWLILSALGLNGHNWSWLILVHLEILLLRALWPCLFVSHLTLRPDP